MIRRLKQNIRRRNNYYDERYATILFLISPFLALIIAFKNYSSSISKNIIWLFIIFYGYMQVMPPEGADLITYKTRFIEVSKLEISFSNFSDQFYNADSEFIDVFYPTLNFVVSRFTSNHLILFAIFGLIGGYFLSRNIWYVIELRIRNINFTGFLFCSLLFSLIAFWNMGNFRLWLGMNIYFYGVIPFLVDNNKKRLWFAFGSALVHFMFVYAIMSLLIYIILKNRPVFYFVFFILTTLFVEANSDLLTGLLKDFAPGLFKTKIDAYSNPDLIKEISLEGQSYTWHLKLYSNVLKWSIYIFLIFLFAKSRKYISENPKMVNLFNYSFLFYGMANIANIIPSGGGRFINIACLFVFSLLFMYSQYRSGDRKFSLLFKICSPLIIFLFIMSIRFSFEMIGIKILFGNPILSMFITNDSSLIDLIKKLAL